MSSKRYRTCITNPYICPDDTACQSPNITINTVGSSGSVGPTGATGAPGKDGTIITNGNLLLHSLSFGSLDPKSTDPPKITINPSERGIQFYRNVVTNNKFSFSLEELTHPTHLMATNPTPLALTIDVNDPSGNVMTVEDGLAVSLPITNGGTANFQYLTTEYFSGVTGYFSNLIVDNLIASGFEGGVTGSTGPTGQMGADGKQGKDGKDGNDGPTGYTGYTGPAGQDGSGIIDGKVEAYTAIFSDINTGKSNVWINDNSVSPSTDISDGFIKVGGNSKGMIVTDGLLVNDITDLYGRISMPGSITGNAASFDYITTNYITGGSGHFTYLSADNMDTSNTNLFPTKNGLISMGYDSVNTLSQLQQLRKQENTVNSIYIGNDAGSKSFGSQTINIGMDAGFEKQSDNCIAIGSYCGQTSQNPYCIAMGVGSGVNNQGIGSSMNDTGYATAVGYNAGGDSQKGFSIAVGAYAGNISQGMSSVAIGYNSALKNQGDNAIAIGKSAGSNKQGANAIAIGNNAGSDTQSNDAISIGSQSALTAQLEGGITIGSSACPLGQGANSIAIGYLACPKGQGNQAINIGYKSGESPGTGENPVSVSGTPCDGSITIGNESLTEGQQCSIYGSKNHIDPPSTKSSIIGNNCALINCANCSIINCDTSMIKDGTNITMISSSNFIYDNGLLNQPEILIVNNHPIGFSLRDDVPVHTVIDPANNPDLKFPVILYSLDIPYGGVWDITCNINLASSPLYNPKYTLVFSILLNAQEQEQMALDPKNVYLTNYSTYQFSRKIKSIATGPHVMNNIKIVLDKITSPDNPDPFAIALDTNNSYIEAICCA